MCAQAKQKGSTTFTMISLARLCPIRAGHQPDAAPKSECEAQYPLTCTLRDLSRLSWTFARGSRFMIGRMLCSSSPRWWVRRWLAATMRRVGEFSGLMP